MAFTYLSLNIFFCLVIVLIFLRMIRRPTKAWWLALILLLVLTTLFDNLLIGAHIVGYNSDKILGVSIGLAPIEDFFYPVLAMIITPTLWNIFSNKKKVGNKS